MYLHVSIAFLGKSFYFDDFSYHEDELYVMKRIGQKLVSSYPSRTLGNSLHLNYVSGHSRKQRQRLFGITYLPMTFDYLQIDKFRLLRLKQL